MLGKAAPPAVASEVDATGMLPLPDAAVASDGLHDMAGCCAEAASMVSISSKVSKYCTPSTHDVLAV